MLMDKKRRSIKILGILILFLLVAYPIVSAIYLNDVEDVDTDTAVSCNILHYNGTMWTNYDLWNVSVTWYKPHVFNDIITAISYYGDGGNLTNVSASMPSYINSNAHPHNQDLNISNNVVFENVTAYAGNFSYVDKKEIDLPSTPSSNLLRLFVQDFKGFSFYKYLDDTGMLRQIARDNIFVVRNKESFTINKMSAVFDNGSTGNVPYVSLAKADSLLTMPSIGIAIEDITSNSFGRVMMLGLLENVNTNAFVEGNLLYVSDTVAGGLTITPPVSPSFTQEMGTVLVKGIGNGVLQVISRALTGDEFGTINNFSIQKNLTVNDNIYADDITLSLYPYLDKDYSNDMTSFVGHPHNQNLNTTSAVTFSTVDTGQGANELYDMNQNVLTTSDVSFNKLTYSGSGTFIIEVNNYNFEMENSLSAPSIKMWNTGEVDFKYQSSVRAVFSSGTSQIVNSGAWTRLNLNAEEYDLNNDYNTGTYRFTVPRAGKYMISYSVMGNSFSDRQELRAGIYKNGVLTGAYSCISSSTATTTNLTATCTDILYLSVSDYLELYVYQNSGSAKTFVQWAPTNYMNICKLA